MANLYCSLTCSLPGRHFNQRHNACTGPCAKCRHCPTGTPNGHLNLNRNVIPVMWHGIGHSHHLACRIVTACSSRCLYYPINYYVDILYIFDKSVFEQQKTREVQIQTCTTHACSFFHLVRDSVYLPILARRTEQVFRDRTHLRIQCQWNGRMIPEFTMLVCALAHTPFHSTSLFVCC